MCCVSFDQRGGSGFSLNIGKHIRRFVSHIGQNMRGIFDEKSTSVRSFSSGFLSSFLSMSIKLHLVLPLTRTKNAQRECISLYTQMNRICVLACLLGDQVWQKKRESSNKAINLLQKPAALVEHLFYEPSWNHLWRNHSLRECWPAVPFPWHHFIYPPQYNTSIKVLVLSSLEKVFFLSFFYYCDTHSWAMHWCLPEMSRGAPRSIRCYFDSLFFFFFTRRTCADAR